MEKAKFFVLLILCFLSLKAVAGSDEVCNDLHRLTCAPGTYDDGTGTATNTSYLSNKSSDLQKKMIEKSKIEFYKILLDPDNVYFRKSVLSATGLSESPQCQAADKKPNAECLNLMAEATADILANQQFNPYERMSREKYSSRSISDTTYVTDSPLFKKVQDGLTADLRGGLNEVAINKKIQNIIFPQVKSTILAKIDLMVSDPALRDSLKDKIKAIQYIGSDCSKDYGAENSIPGILVSNAFYNPAQNTFKYCLGMGVQNTSEYQLAFVIAHELSHSIDPCGISRGPSDFAFKYKSNLDRAKAEQEFPFNGVIGCLRSDKSVHAIFQGQVQQNGYSGAQVAQSNIPVNKDPLFCQNDQITESFADWMAAEILPDYMEKNHPQLTVQQKRIGYSNIWRGACQSATSSAAMAAMSSALDPHPSQEARTNDIILMQPKIRTQMGCPPTVPDRVYCSINNTIASACKECSGQPNTQQRGTR